MKGETTFNRRNLRRRLLQQRTNGFHMDVHESLDTIRQNSQNIRTLLTHTNKPNESLAHEIGDILSLFSHIDIKKGPLNPFNFSTRRLKIGQWVDVKDTIDQWVFIYLLSENENNTFSSWKLKSSIFEKAKLSSTIMDGQLDGTNGLT